MSSIYGIDILDDNVRHCRDRLLGIFEAVYRRLFGDHVKERCLAAAHCILERNVIWGDALTLMTVDARPEPIIFSEWSPVNGSLLKRRDFSFSNLLAHESNKELPLFSDLGDEVFVPSPEKDYPPVHFLELANDGRQ